jgi:o-succinylbenzoate---CoA ligase
VPNDSFIWPSRPDAPFLWSERLRLTHGTVARQAAAHADTLPRNDRVLLRIGPGPLGIAPIIACWMRGVTVILADPRESDEMLDRRAHALDAPIWVPGPPLGLSSRADQPLDLPLDTDAVALQTSGSSGEPKWAVHRLRSLLANAEASNRRVPLAEGDSWLLSLSPHHIGGLGIIVRAMVAGAGVYVGASPGAVASDLRSERAITHVSVVATQLRRLLDEPALDRRLVALRALLLGGGPTPTRWREEALDRGWPLCVTYGLTECASQVTTSLAMRGLDATDAGLPLDGVGVRCDEAGEIHVSGPTVFRGYLDGATVRGEFATGDVGRFDECGRLHVPGRRDAVSISGGENIRPEEIENVLRAIPGITNACVVAVDDPQWVKRPVAFVAGVPSGTTFDVALAGLPRFKWPDRILRMPAEEAERAKPRRAMLLGKLDAPLLWVRR